MSKPLIFTNNTANDKGSIIPNNVIKWDRFRKNPVCLRNHKWDDDPIGFWTGIKNMNGLSINQDGDLCGTPVLHEITDTATRTKALYESGNIRGASIGGVATYRADPSGRRDKDGNPLPYFNQDGLMECLEFDLYEISIVTLPSNQDAVTVESTRSPLQLSAHVYTRDEIRQIEQGMTVLSTKYKFIPMEQTPTATPAATAPPEPVTAAKPTAVIIEPSILAAAPNGDILTMKAGELPGFMDKIIKSVASAMGITKHNAVSATPTNLPETKPASDEPLHVPQPTPIGLTAQAKAAYDTALQAAEQAVHAAQALRAKAVTNSATDKEKGEYDSAKDKAKDCMAAAEAAFATYQAAMKFDADGDDGDDMKAKATHAAPAAAGATPPGQAPANTPTKPAATALTTGAPSMKTLEQLKAENLKLEGAPLRVRVGQNIAGKTFTELNADKGEGRSILMRTMASDAANKQISDYEVVLNSIIQDGKYAAITKKMRVMMNVQEGQLEGLTRNPKLRGGVGLKEIAQQLAAGEITYYDRMSGSVKKLTQLTSTDNALAAPALNTIEWLPLAIFKLFPSTSWKNPIPLFGAEMTGKNTGIIWAEIASDPTIYKGNQPANPASYSVADNAIALSLTPYWMQPCIWTPLTMHQLRYDQMATQWAQNFAKMNTVMDDNLLYQLGSLVPASAIYGTTGISGYQTNAKTFYVNGVQNINQFYYNPAFVGNLISPALNDIITGEQLYNQQNFPLEDMETRLVIDPIMEAQLKMDPESKSLLTRFVTEDGKDLLKYSHTVFNQRSRVLAYDPASGQIKDPNGVMAATVTSAALGFIPSQVALGLGMLDVFMVQDPTNYGYKMSADIRIGAAAMRFDYAGLIAMIFGAGNV